MMSKSKPILTAVAALLLASGGCASSDTANSMTPRSGPDFAAALRGRVSTDAMMAHLTKLQDIANANGNTRAVGTPGYDASVDYVVGKLRDKGFDVQTMQFDAHVFHAEPGSVTVADKKFDARKPRLQRRRLRQLAGQRRSGAGGPWHLPVRPEGESRR
jgi:hypothetical protein